MSVLATIKGLLTAPLTDDSTDGFDQLVEALQNDSLDLVATYGKPSLNAQGEDTATFPYTVYDRSGGEDTFYAQGRKEFPIPDDGLDATDSGLVTFVGKRHGVAPENVDVESLAAVQGTTSPVTIGDGGDLVVA